MAQSAVEWLVQQMADKEYILWNDKPYWLDVVNLIDQAKQMQEQQTIDSYKHGQNNGYNYRSNGTNYITGEEYFEQTYKTQVRHEKHSRLGSNDGNDV